MYPEGEEVAVIVIAGSWECSAEGIWDFVIAKECFARSIPMSMQMTYEELIFSVSTEFELHQMRLKPKLSYWLPCQLSMFSVNRRPPVVITTHTGLRSFLNIRRSAVHLNMLLSLDGSVGEAGTSGVRRVCAGDEETIPSHGNDGVVRMYTIGTSSMDEVVENNERTVRRRLFPALYDKGKGILVDDGVAGSMGLRPYSVGAGPSTRVEGINLNEEFMRENSQEQWPNTDCAGIINLADAATPSLSRELGNPTEGGFAITEAECTSVDELDLLRIQMLEKMHEDLAKDKARTKEPETVGGGGSVDYFTDAVTTSDSEDEQLDEWDNWSDFDPEGDLVVPVMEEGGPSNIRQSPPGDVVVPVFEEGGPSSIAEGLVGELDSSWFEDPSQATEKDVGDEVLSYVTRSGMPLSLENFYEDCNEQGTLPTNDAEPVFDDVIDLTNTNGCAGASSEEDAIYIGRIFKDKQDMQDTISIYAIKRLFYFRQTRSCGNRLIFVCVDPRCRWRVFGHRVRGNSSNFEVRTATLTHTCSITARAQYAKLASARVIGTVLERRFANGLRGPRAIEIPDIVLQELKVSVTYMKAWQAKEAAIRKTRGDDAESYQLLATYMYLLKQGNPGTLYKLEYKTGPGDNKLFKYLFLSLAASIAGIKFMRKVILVDGTVIKSKFKGVLLTASMQDANFQVFPIAFRIVDSENKDAWTWFFNQLSLIVPDAEDLVLVSDRHRSIYAGVAAVYPKAFHGACAVHIERNVRHFGGIGLANLVGKAARAFNVGDYRLFYDEICKRSKKLGEYLDDIPREHWTQAYCEARRYNIMSSNIAEALNAALAKIIELPIVTMVEAIRTKLMQWFCIRRAKAKRLAKAADPVTPNVNKLMLRYHADSAGLAVLGVTPWSYQVNTHLGKSYYVDLKEKTCTCLQFQKLLIPCCHTLAAARINGIYIPSLIGVIYNVIVWGDSYAEYIYPVPNQCDAEIPAVVEETRFKPPTNPPGPGCRRKRRIPSTGENVGTKRRKTGPHKCSTCSQSGHNRATCPNPAF